MGKIIDCCCFFNERFQLLCRLNELDSVVDKFVIVESAWTQSLQPKPYYLDQWIDEPDFSPFLDKIVRVKVDEKFEGNIWSHDIGQRNCIIRGLEKIEGLKEDDVILISDVDELPKAELVKNVIVPPESFVTFQLGYFCYYANLRVLDEAKNNFRWNGSVATYYKMYSRFTPHQIIKFRDYVINGNASDNLIEDAGHHISYLGKDVTMNKYKSCVEPMDKINGIPVKEVFDQVWQERARPGGSFIMCDDLPRKHLELKLVDLSTLPKYLQDNQEKYKEIIWKE